MKKIIVLCLLTLTPVFAVSEHSDLKKLEKHVKYLESLGSRFIKTEGNSKAALYILNELEKYGYHPEKDFFTSENFKMFNVLSGSSDKTKPVILLSAHFDSISFENGVLSDKSPGADDNASGVSALLELARILKKEKLNIEFVFFNCEEINTAGSRHLAELYAGNSYQIKYMINIDTIGTWEGPVSVKYPVNFVSDKKSMKLIDKMKEKMPFELKPAKELWLDDHANFWEKGYTAVEITEDGCTDYMHRPGDTSEKINFENIKIIVDALADFMRIEADY